MHNIYYGWGLQFGTPDFTDDTQSCDTQLPLAQVDFGFINGWTLT